MPSRFPPPRFFFAAALAAVGAGCTMGPEYSRPQPKLASHFDEPGATAAIVSRPEDGVEPVEKWWRTFHDTELDSLVRRALAGNRDLKIVASRLRQARIERAIALGGLWPTVDVNAGYNRGHGSENVDLPFGNPAGGSAGAGSPSLRAEQDAANVPPPPPPPPSGSSRPPGPTSPLGEGGFPGVTTNLYQAGFDASWEIDLFGGHRRATEAAGAEVEATEEAQRAVVVSLLAEVAQGYLQLRADQRERELARENIGVAQETLDIVKAKERHGLATDLEVTRQSAELGALQAAVPALETAERLSIHALGYLIGVAPAALEAELSTPQPLPLVPEVVPVGLPSDLLRRRPDIRRAEREIAGASARIGLATADLFPRFDLAAALGVDSSRPADLLHWSSRYYSLTPGVRWTLLDWGRAKNGVRLADESKAEALARYEATVDQAVVEVEDALVRYRNEQRAQAARTEARDASRMAFNIARQRYEHGIVDSLVVLDAQRSLLAAEDALAKSEANVRLNLVALYKALGGGWET